MHLIVTKKHRAHLFISFNKTHSASRFSQFYAKQKINLAWPYFYCAITLFPLFAKNLLVAHKIFECQKT